MYYDVLCTCLEYNQDVPMTNSIPSVPGVLFGWIPCSRPAPSPGGVDHELWLLASRPWGLGFKSKQGRSLFVSAKIYSILPSFDIPSLCVNGS